METLVPERVETGDGGEKLGLTSDQIDRLVPQLLDEIRRAPADRRLPKAFYFRQQQAGGGWLTRGLGLHPNRQDFLLHDFPRLDDPYIFYSRMETVYLPVLCSPPDAGSLLSQSLDDRQPKLKPLLDLPVLLKSPEAAGRDSYRELTAGLSASLEHTRAKLASLGCRLPVRQNIPPAITGPAKSGRLGELTVWLASKNPAGDEAEMRRVDPNAPIDPVMVSLFAGDELIRGADEIAEAVNAGRDKPLDPEQIRPILARLNRLGWIQRVNPGYYANWSLDLTGFKPHQLPGPTSSRIVSLLEANASREFNSEDTAEGLNRAGDRFATKTVDPRPAQDCLQYLARQDRIKRTGIGVYACLDHPKPAYQTPTVPDAEQIVDLIDQNPKQSFTKTMIIARLAGRDGQPPSAKHIKNLISGLVSQGLIKQISYDRYASQAHPEPAYQLISDRVLAVVNSQPDRLWTSAEVHQAANADPDQAVPPVELDQVRTGLTYLAHRTGQIKPVYRGRYASQDCRLPKFRPGAKVADRLANLLEAQGRDFGPTEAAAQLSQGSGPTTTSRYAGLCLRQLVSQGRARLTGRGRYAAPLASKPQTKPVGSADQPRRTIAPKPKPAAKRSRRQAAEAGADPYPIAPPPPKSAPRVSLGRRIGRLTQDRPDLTAPNEIVDGLENDNLGPFNRELARELAGSALRRRDRLNS